MAALGRLSILRWCGSFAAVQKTKLFFLLLSDSRRRPISVLWSPAEADLGPGFNILGCTVDSLTHSSATSNRERRDSKDESLSFCKGKGVEEDEEERGSSKVSAI